MSFREFCNTLWRFIEYNLKVIAAVSVVLIFCLAISIVVVSNKNKKIAYRLEEERGRVCFTPGCISRAAIILNNMDVTVDPCEDFYKFVCGRFLKKTVIPDDQYSVTAFTNVKNTVYQQIRKMLEEHSKPEESKSFVLTRELYNTCTNTSAIETDGLSTINDILQSLNGWPLLEGLDWYDLKFDWKQSMYTLRNIGYDANYFLSINILTDLKNSSRRIICIDQAVLELPRSVILAGGEHRLMKIYYDYMVDIAVILGANRSLALQDIQEVLNLQIEIANISLPFDKRQNETLLYNPMSIKAFQKVYPKTNWKQYIKYLLDIPEFQILDDEIINVRVPKYLDDLEELLNKTSKRVQANYIMWRVVSASIPYLNKELTNRKLKFLKTYSGERKPLPRWKECIFQTLYRFWQPLRTLYDRKHFNKKSKVVATQMVLHIQSEFSKILHSTEWMDKTTKQRAQEKAEGMTMRIGSLTPDTDEDFSEFYSALNFNHESYLKKILAVALFNKNNNFRKLRKAVEKEDRDRDISLEYRIYVPGGIFQEVFFNNEQPHYMNYGGIGSLMGHLVTHGFDNMGRQFDKYNDLVNWWTNETESAYIAKAQCVIDQYNNYTVPDVFLNVNGRNTRDENIADMGGLITAYKAYKTWSAHNDPEQQLPGLNYTSLQMFWISFANMYCSKYRNQQLTMIVLAYHVSPDYYRVIGPVRNLQNFAKDFDCPIGSKMNPKEKCKVW